MDTELKKEFKSFVSDLSIEICKKVLVDDMTRINGEFKCYSSEYKKQLEEFRSIEKNFKAQTNTFIQMNNLISKYSSGIEIQSKNIESALKVVNTDYKIVLNNIIQKNEKALKEYQVEVAGFNKQEKDIFINDFKSELNKVILKAVNDIKAENNMAKLKKIDSDLAIQKINIDKIMKGQKEILEESIDIYEEVQALEEEIKNNNTKLIETNRKNKKIENELDELRENIKVYKNTLLTGILILMFMILVVLFKVF